MTAEQMKAKIQEDDKWIRLMETVDKGYLTPVIEIRKAELDEVMEMVGV